MYPSNRSQDLAAAPSRSESIAGQGRERFRPVALPALAAAVNISNAATQTARAKLAAQQTVRIVHEDEPFL